MIPKHRSPSVRKPRRSSRPAARGFASTSGLLDSARFFHLLSRRNRRNAARLDREIEARSTQELSVLMCDSSGFTRKTHQHGILPFLAVMTKAVAERIRGRFACVYDRSSELGGRAVELYRVRY